MIFGASRNTLACVCGSGAAAALVHLCVRDIPRSQMKMPEEDLPILKGLLQHGVAPHYMSKFLLDFCVLALVMNSGLRGRREVGKVCGVKTASRWSRSIQSIVRESKFDQ